MAGASRTISVRLTVAEADTFRTAMQNAGLQGSTAFTKITQAAQQSSQALQQHTATGQLANYQLIEIAETAHKFADQILSGGSAVKALAYELPNAIGIAGGFKNAMAALGGALPLVALGAAAAGIVAMGVAAESQQSRLRTLGQQVRATRDDYDAYAATLDKTARSLAQHTTLSTADARTAVNAIGTNPNFSGTSADITRLAKDAQDLSVILKTDLAFGTKVITDGLNDAAKAAKELEDKGIAGFTPGLVRTIELLQQGGHFADAFSLYLKTLEDRSKGAADSGLTGLGTALKRLDEAFNGSRDGAKSWSESIGGFFDVAAARGINNLSALIEKMGEAQKFGSDTTIAIPGQAMTTVPTANLPSDPLGAAARASGLDIALLRAQSTMESGGNPNAVSSAGAVGLMGLLPGTFGDMQKKYGFSGAITDPTANAVAGALYMREQLDAQSGNLRNAAAAYNEGPSNFAKGLMPDETRNYQAQLFRAYPYGSGIVGPAAAPGTLGSFAPMAEQQRILGTLPSMHSEQYGPPALSYSSSDGVMTNDGRKDAEDLDKQMQGTRALASQTLAAQMSDIQRQLQRLEVSGQQGTPEYQGLLEREQGNRAAQYNNVDPQTQATREGQRQLDSARLARRYGYTPAGDQLSADLSRRDDIAHTTGSPVTDDVRNQVTSQFYEKAKMELDRLEEAQKQAAAGNEALAGAYAKGGTAVADLTAKNEALHQIGLLLPKDAANYQQELDKLTTSYRNVATSAADIKAAQQTAADTKDIASLRMQAGLISSGASSDAQKAAMAGYDAQQSNQNASPAFQAAAVSAAKQRVQAASDLQAVKANATEISNFTSNAFDKIGSSITGAFTEGKNAAASFGSITKGIITDLEQEFIKLAVINPLKNAFAGGSSALPTLGSVGGSLLGGASSINIPSANAGDGLPITAASGYGGGGLLSGVGSFFSGLFHSGGIVGSGEGSGMRQVDPSIFYGARRMHSGGIADGEVPAVLQAGEGVFTPGQMAAIGANMNASGGDTHFNFSVNAQGAGPREIDQLRSQIPLMAMSAVQSGMQRGGSFAKAVRGG